MTYPVRRFDHFQEGAPQLTNAFGSLTELLDAVLVNGFGVKTISTLTCTGGIATATTSTAHKYKVADVLLIAGATPIEYNGECRVLSVTSSSFTYAPTATAPTAPATGTITAKIAPLGWEIAFSATSKRAYRSTNALSKKHILRVDDSMDPLWAPNWAKYAKVTMAESMSDIDTFVGGRAPYDPTNPTRNEIATGTFQTSDVVNGWYKWGYAHSHVYWETCQSVPATANRPWVVIGDDRGFYLFNDSLNGAQGYGARCFTEFQSFRPGDAFATILTAQDWIATSAARGIDIDGNFGSSDATSYFPGSGNTKGKILMRGFMQIGNPVVVSLYSLNTNENTQVISGRSTGIAFPNGPDAGLLLHPYYIKEGTSTRGRMPGVYCVHNDNPPFATGDILTGVTGYPGRMFVIQKTSWASEINTAMVAFDLTGPWW